MAFQQVPNTAEIAVSFTVNGQALQNTFHGKLGSGYVLADLTSLADAIDYLVGVEFKPLWSVDTVYNHVEVRGLHAENDNVVINADSAGAGSVAVVPYPCNVAYCIKKLSSLTGRSARGRVYIAGMPTNIAGSNENFITAAASAAWVDAVEEIRLGIAAEGWTPVIVSRWSNGVLRTPATTFNWTATGATDLRLDSRRDRMP